MSHIVRKIKDLAESKIKKNASIYDKKHKLPEYVTKFFNKNSLSLLLNYHTKKKSLNYKQENDFFYYATKYCSNVRNYFLVSIGMVGAGIFRYGNIEQKRIFIKNISDKKAIFSLAITEKQSGSDIQSIKTNYKFKNNKYIINGEKIWITLGTKAKFFLLLANGEFGLLLFMVKKNNSIQSKKLENITSNKGSYIAKLKIKDLILGEKDILGGKKSSLDALDYILMNGRAIASIAAASMAEAALEETIDYAKKRTQFGKRIFQYQQIQEILSSCSVSIEAAKLIAEKSFKEKRKNNIDVRYYCNSSKLLTSKIINDSTYELSKVFGAYSNSEKFNIERYSREARAFLFIEGTSQILSQLISSYLISKY
jgi:alkylation response protein AidB-like acyl-CoA dehydrogenase